MKLRSERLVIVSNRLPVTIDKSDEGYRVEPSSGGLVTALRPIIRQHNGCWVGWTGTDYQPEIAELLASGLQSDCALVPVFLTPDERAGFYCGFCNEIIWPLFHDLQSRCNFEPDYWRRYVAVNEKFADTLASVVSPHDILWVHDYHLMLQSDCLRQRGVRTKLAYFHHIPFPPPDIFEKLPWRLEILRSLLSFDTVGFQTARDRHNFVGCVRRFLYDAPVRHAGRHLLVETGEHCAVVGTFPIGIDFDEFASLAASEEGTEQARRIREDVAGRPIVLGVDRLDYTKGVPERLKAFRSLLAAHPDLRGQITLIQIVVPSREEIPEYQGLKLEVERLVSQINGAYGTSGWVPIHYLHRHLPRPELVAYYRAADIALITPLKDGMNLVAKEFCAAQVEENAVLILSEFAGAADQLARGSLLVNPYDCEGVAAAIARGYHMPAAERQERMRSLRENVRKENVFWWCESFLRQSRRGALDSEGGIPKRARRAIA